MQGIRNILEWLNNNWTFVCVVIGLLLGIYEKVKSLFKRNADNKAELDREELNRQIESAKHHISEAMLKMITDAEQDYDSWMKAGEIKRSQVIKQIYDEYPILDKVIDQEEIVAWIDEQINQSLKTLRRVISENKAVSVNGDS